MTNTQDHILVVISDTQITFLLDRVLRSAGFSVGIVQEGLAALKQAATVPPSLVILGERLSDGHGLEFASEFGRRFPAVPVVLLFYQDNQEQLKRAMRLGVNDFLAPPLRSEEILRSVKNAIEISQRRKEALLLESRRYTSTLQRQLDELETLIRLSRQVTGQLDTDHVLSAVIDAAVELTGAEEGSLLLVDDETGELYMRAARNFQEDFVRTFRLPITDSLAGSVMRSGQTILLDENTPQKIKTAYLVQSLAYVPLESNGHVFGVMGVDNRESRLPLTQKHVKMLKALAGYAVIALENARLYGEIAADRNKLEAILTGVQDGVIVMDQQQRLVLVNRAAREYFHLDAETNLAGQPFREIFQQDELKSLIAGGGKNLANVTEFSPDENRELMVRATPIPEIGLVLTMHDITNLKKLDRIKTDFVHTVSHDLRSPLTAILGYVELLERVGPLNDTQKDFIRRVQVSVHNITRLVDNLLELGRIESNLDAHREYLRLDSMVEFAVEAFKKQIDARGLSLKIEFQPDFPSMLANPVHIRQMVDHLLDNAIKYTRPKGKIKIIGRVEQNQAILQFNDTGVGIPAMDLPYIFDKFYRGSNANAETSGTGLGLAIVKSIVEAHNGRVWVESVVGEGTTITIVLPL